MINRSILFILFYSYIYPLPLEESDCIDFIEARYAGADSTVYSMISNDFIYNHIPYVGLGILTEYRNGSLLITHIVNDSLQTNLKVGDKIHEVNGKVVSKNTSFNGAVGSEQKLIVTKRGDSTFSTIYLPLIQIQYSQNDSLFLLDIVDYRNTWYDYHVEILDIINHKNKAAVYYLWEGSKKENGPVYYFNAIELFYIDDETDLINRVDGLWSEKQFRDQFR